MDANMFCLNNDMEFLRIESQSELLSVKKALKLRWLEFETQVHIYGIRTKEGKWKFLSNNVEVDPVVYIVPYQGYGEVLALSKIKFDLEIGIGNDADYNFLCQKNVNSENEMFYEDSLFLEENDNKLLKVSVTERMFEKINSNQKSYFINRLNNYNLSPFMAENFCRIFGMKLATITWESDFENLISIFARDEERLYKNFLVGVTRSTLNEYFTDAFKYNDKSLSQTKTQQCVLITLEPRLIRKHQIIYFDCNKYASWKLNFICEPDEFKTGLYVTSKVKQPVGMKQIGTQSFDTSSVNYYVNDIVKVKSWFEAFSYCKALGMDLFSPKSKDDTNQIVQFLENQKLESSFFIGGSRIGTEAFWYSTKTGHEIEVDPESKVWSTRCLGLFKTGEKYEYYSLACDEGNNFICES